MTESQPLIQVREPGGEEDLDHIRRLFRSYLAEFAGSFAEALCFDEFEAEVADLPGRYAPPSGCLLLAIAGDVPAGCVAMRDLDGGECEMKRLYVAPVFRGWGVGRVLIAEIIERATQAGHRRMVLDTLPEMVQAIALYRSFGFVATSAYRRCPVERVLYLEKRLRG